MLKRNDEFADPKYYEIDGPAMLHINGSLFITVREDGSVLIDGTGAIDIRSDEELNLESKNVNIKATEDMRINTGNNLYINCEEDFNAV